MESNITPNEQDTQDTQDTKYKQVTVDVPADRIAQFHAFFGRFLAGSTSRRRGTRGRHLGRGHMGHGHRGRGCAHRRKATEPREREEQRQPATEATEL
jgi:hypothetical protein